MRHIVALSILILLPIFGLAADLPPVSRDAIEAHATFLADDTLLGRNTGSEGFAIAANYAAAQFRQYGLKPAGDDGTFFQQVPFIESRRVGSVVDIVAKDETVELSEIDDYIIWGSETQSTIEGTAPVVFVGYGIDASELGHRDYKGVDVKGKIVLMFNGAPASFPSDERAHFSSTRLKAEEAAKRGAVGMIRIRTKIDKAKVSWERYLSYATPPIYRWMHPDGRLQDVHEDLVFSGVLSSDGARKFAAAADLSYDELLNQAESVEYETRILPVELKVRADTMHTKIRSPNILALLEGGDPKLSKEFIVISAHLDHVGVGDEIDGDRIHNGFYDNAMGSSIVLELARILTNAETKPARSIVFLLVTGEEKGLLGSDYFARYPTVPREAVVANVNVDMPLFLHPVADVVAYGAEHSSIGEVARRAAEANGFTLSPDPDPAEVIFVRSDQYSFIRQGVPAIYLDPGSETVGGGDEGRKAVGQFLRKHYHRPSDDTSRPVDWDSVVRFTRMNVMMTRELADAPARPRWNKGDFFGVLFNGYGAK